MNIKELREYLNEQEAGWTDLDEEYLGKFEDQPVWVIENNCLHHMKVEYCVTGIGYIAHADSAIKKGDKL